MSNKKAHKKEIAECQCELVGISDVCQLEGKLKTLVEGMGLSEKQEKAQKDIVNSVLWSWYNHIRRYYTDYLGEKRNWYKENKLKKVRTSNEA